MKWTQISEIMQRRWRVMVLTGLIVLVASVIALQPKTEGLLLTMRFIVGQPPLDSTLSDEQERYYTWVTSEYVVFSISDWINGTAFFELLLEELQAQGYEELEFKDVKGRVGATSYRSILLMEVRDTDREFVLATAAAATKIVTSLPDVDIPQLRLTPPILFPIDSIPSITEPTITITEQLRIPLSITLAIVCAIVAAALSEQADKTIRSRDIASTLKLPILGEIPAG